MKEFKLSINNKSYTIQADENMPLLWALRDYVGLKGTKFGCGIAQCGACTVLLDGTAIRSCTTPLMAIEDQKIMTIEGVEGSKYQAVQKAWIEEQVPQCGYCQSGQIMSAINLLSENANPSDEAIDEGMQGNICRCGTYDRIRKAIKRVAADGSIQ